ncbi:3,4-dihydroxy-2-butanone 4-phosphate synthase [Candidatus Methanoplasma termitum]|uniref:3,4-dihydroxy-2-butanone 4-phosphate synthase n=1 Tax=Candidatus Methanoplasma termitum TaxID=1577791 RepID=A0A0A7LC43_9ARCH|nr:3,4-dihydroxy-2-butanone-4-phosphate synthase [Candidatus Methanoplasma termitum]AIZ56604.1 3,4-dihydroxy-2-butanone 4-phosphate synthase [Candidatus Methanoplasma termitum]MCL2334083.1 3,4-dihydroxy-2-butanone-4-phosphate synthase [Candidatus Methanoplasma sp.]
MTAFHTHTMNQYSKVNDIDAALRDIRAGKIVLVYDFDERERETDMTIASEFVTPAVLRKMRTDAGGLICTTTPSKTAKELGLPFLSDVFWNNRNEYPLLGLMAPNDIPYDHTKSSFGITINHRRTYTGITDNDRALTIKEYVNTIFKDAPAEDRIRDLGEHFRAPGHVHLLNTTSKLLKTRHGHTELCTALMYMAGVKPSATICEIMGDNGSSRPKEWVIDYAKKNDLSFVTGQQVIDAWEYFINRTGMDV